MRRTFAAAIGAVSVAAMLSGAGLAAASAPAAHGTEHFQIMSTSATASTNSIIATGLFTAGGVNHPGTTTDKAVFPGGTFKIKHSPGKGTQSFNPKTCLLTLNLHGPASTRASAATATTSSASWRSEPSRAANARSPSRL